MKNDQHTRDRLQESEATENDGTLSVRNENCVEGRSTVSKDPASLSSGRADEL